MKYYNCCISQYKIPGTQTQQKTQHQSTVNRGAPSWDPQLHRIHRAWIESLEVDVVVSCEGSMAPSRRCFDTFVNPKTKGADLEAQQIYNDVEGNKSVKRHACFLFFVGGRGYEQ